MAAAENPAHKGHKEDCVEECKFFRCDFIPLFERSCHPARLATDGPPNAVFHMTHCVAQCAAPKLFRQLA